MMTVYLLMELAATLTENVIVLSAVTTASHPKFRGKTHLAVIWGMAGVMVIPITILNNMQTFSYLTIIVGMGYVVAVTKISSQGHFLVRATTCVMTFFVLHSLGLVLKIAEYCIISTKWR